GRAIATLYPNHTYEKVVFDPWQQVTWDVNDTVTADPRTDRDISGYVSDYFATQPKHWQTWYAQRQVGDLGAQEQAAATKAAAHANTPTTAYFDTLGRPFLTLAHNGQRSDGTPDLYPTRVELDIEGNQRTVRDAIIQADDPQGRIVMRYDYDLLGNRIHQASMEAGSRWMFNNVVGNPLRAWDSRGHTFRTEYDPLRRPLRHFVTGANPSTPNQELLTERSVYGEQHPEAVQRNLKGQLYLHFDQAGVASTEAYDFKNNLFESSRRLEQEYKQAVDWQAIDEALPVDATAPLDPAALEAVLAPRLEANTFTSHTIYDALNRPVTMETPDSSIIRPGYNEANLLERIEVNLQGADTATNFVENIDYDAKGQRTQIAYGNGIITTYDYDPLTFRLVQMHTLRRTEALQDLAYTYDPAGNITYIRDSAQQTLYFRNHRVEPSNDYTYDAIYRLIKATGREHLGQTGGNSNAPTPPDAFNSFHTRLEHPGDGNAMGRYVEQYVYDAVGNILSMQHRGSDPAHAGWARTYTYKETSLLEPTKQSNRLSNTTLAGANPKIEPYQHNIHGNITRMPHLANQANPHAANMHWNYKDQLRQADLGGGGTAYYTYDAAGQRMRKVVEKSPGRTEERIYLGGFEVFRQLSGEGKVKLERETLHIMDNQQRVALVETRTIDIAKSDPAPPQLIRFQLGNHLGSASAELDSQAHIISYEEFTPYGNTAYQSVRSQIEIPKRYRYTGKERDEESGLNYHGARYYAAWLARWISPDPAGFVDGFNLYVYAQNEPIIRVDLSGLDSEITIYHRTTEAGAANMARNGASTSRSRPHVWAGGGFYGSGQPDIPSSTSARGDTIVAQTISTERMTTITDEGFIAMQQDDRRGRQLRSAVRSQMRDQARDEFRQAGGRRPSDADVDVRMRDYMSTQMDRLAPDSDVVRWQNPDGAYTYVVRRESALRGHPRVFGHMVGRRFRQSAASGRGTSTSTDGGGGTGSRRGRTPRGRRGGGGTLGKIIAVGIAAYVLFDTGDVYAAAQTANPVANTTDAFVSGNTSASSVAGSVVSDAYGLTPIATVEWVVSDLLGPGGTVDNYLGRTTGWDEDLANRALREGRNPFCAQCHGPGGALDPSNEWNSRFNFESFPESNLLNDIDYEALRGFIEQ
ncbi:MAG: RHS repeat-associated core domain-containing protein, partial [Cyanobacteria bacterium J06638_22]